jgi:hypothetical protein
MISRLKVAWLVFFLAWSVFRIAGNEPARRAALAVSIIAWLAWGIAESIQKRKGPRP